MKESITLLLLMIFSNLVYANGAGLNIERHSVKKGPSQIEETREKMRENPRNRAMGGSFSQLSSQEEKEEAPTELKRPGNQVWR